MEIKYTIYSIIEQYKCTIYCIEKNPSLSAISIKPCFFVKKAGFLMCICAYLAVYFPILLLKFVTKKAFIQSFLLLSVCPSHTCVRKS